MTSEVPPAFSAGAKRVLIEDAKAIGMVEWCDAKTRALILAHRDANPKLQVALRLVLVDLPDPQDAGLRDYLIMLRTGGVSQ